MTATTTTTVNHHDHTDHTETDTKTPHTQYSGRARRAAQKRAQGMSLASLGPQVSFFYCSLHFFFTNKLLYVRTTLTTYNHHDHTDHTETDTKTDNGTTHHTPNTAAAALQGTTSVTMRIGGCSTIRGTQK